MDLTSALDILVQEARELLSDMEESLMIMEEEGHSSERIDAVFRAAHTIKGSAGLFGLDLIVGFTHVMESVLDQVRSKKLALDPELSALLLGCRDYVGRMIDVVETSGKESDPDPEERKVLPSTSGAQADNKEASLATAHPADGDHEKGVDSDNWHLSLRFGPDVLRQGMDPLSFINYLSGIGQITYLHTLQDRIPSADLMDPETCYLGFEIDLRSDCDKKRLEDVFDFVKDESSIKILPPHAKVSEYIALVNEAPDSKQMLGEILIAGGALTEHELAQVLELQRHIDAGEEGRRLGDLLIHEGIVEAPVVAAALVKQRKNEERKVAENRYVKVEASKLDQLINLVGELVIASAGARILADRARQATLSESLGEVNQLVGQIRDRSLDLRMIPIGEVFQRFPRVVRDVSKELGKQIDLVITGADTELDKSMVDKLGEPLTHMVRNAVDHGIESVEVRLASGKPAAGKLNLHAFHDSGCIVIEIKDDGKGLDSQRIRAKAIEKGLISAEAVLTDAEVQKLIFMPGFSTAEKVTNLSGRGVGMDAVKSAVEQLRGDIDLQSTLGKGTTLRIRLPLTLAIINGFQVAVGNAVFVIPLDMVEECVEFSTVTGHDYTNLRGQVLPFVRIKEVFGIESKEVRRENIVVVKCAGTRFGVVVDSLLGEAQTVIKPLSKIFKDVRGVSGSTILGSGEVALIIDVPVLMQQANCMAETEAV
jgi:two-component system chemotaxis sensor kinase CheA